MSRIDDLLVMETYARKNYGDSAIIKGSEFSAQRKEVCATGIKQLDDALGVGGILAGSIVEIHGLESTGKTALALHIVKKFQRKNKRILYDFRYLYKKNGKQNKKYKKRQTITVYRDSN